MYSDISGEEELIIDRKSVRHHHHRHESRHKLKEKSKIKQILSEKMYIKNF